jgi:hypothetical protein
MDLIPILVQILLAILTDKEAKSCYIVAICGLIGNFYWKSIAIFQMAFPQSQNLRVLRHLHNLQREELRKHCLLFPKSIYLASTCTLFVNANIRISCQSGEPVHIA